MTGELNTKKKRVVSGMRPTGKLHIGHYFGALANWVRLQNDPGYDCFYFIADWHALTSDYADTSAIAQNTIEIVTDYLAAGLDPAKCVIFQQSLVPEHAELYLLLGMVTPLGWLERIPTYKEQIENIKDKDLHTYGFLGYPVLQTADIVIYSKEGTPLFVPVGEDQVSHVELSREIVRRFNVLYGIDLEGPLLAPGFVPARESILFSDFEVPKSTWGQEPEKREELRIAVRSKLQSKILEEGFENLVARWPFDWRQYFRRLDVLTEPQVMLTQTPRIPGTDGRKMSKSYGNAILLSESDESIWDKVRPMKTDPARKRRSDPGNPDVCPVYDWHKLFAPRNAAGDYTAEGKATLEWSATGCRSAGIGCIECKRAMADNLIRWIAPIRARRLEYERNPAAVLRVIDEGSRKARAEAEKTMERVREAVFGWEKKRNDVASGES